MKVNFVLDPVLDASLDAEATRTGLKRSEIVRQALRAHFAAQPKPRRRPVPALPAPAPDA